MQRPKKPPPKVKDVKIRLSLEQYEIVQEAALAAGLEVAVYCRVIVMADALVPTKYAGPRRLRGNTVKSDDAPKSSDEQRTRETVSVRDHEDWEAKKPRGAGLAAGNTSGDTTGDAPVAVRNPGAAA